MSIQCIACARFSFRKAERMGPLGFGNCELKADKSQYMSATYQRECGNHIQASPMIEQERRAWLEKHHLKNNTKGA